MADSESVSAAQFGEFVKRMEDRFDHNDEFAKERHEGLKKRLDDLWKMMGVTLAASLAAAIAAVVKAFL